MPRNVEIAEPFYLSAWTDAPGLALFPRTLLVAEEGSRVAVVEEHASLPSEVEAFSSPVAEVWVGDGAQVRYTTIQRWGEQVTEIGTRRAVVGRDARLEWVTAALGGGLSRLRLQAAFAGEGSESVLRGLYLPSGGQQMHFDTLQEHRAGHTESDLFFKGALRDAARAVYYGVIRVHPQAQQTNGYQQNRNLLLSEKAKADSIPILEIEANDVKCSHGATVGQVDPEQLFYLMARGLPRPEAERLLVEAFFREILDTIPADETRERVAELVRGKVGF
ncbi:MAG: FeS cluster assembly protein SufD [Alphaproteobacteria bacterium ADurb.BinA305]|nr:MAG: FeS cluster assembly protein SufD [Alphaproteobacteria bacterium ADurb.BinA305]